MGVGGMWWDGYGYGGGEGKSSFLVDVLSESLGMKSRFRGSYSILRLHSLLSFPITRNPVLILSRVA